MFLLTHTQKTKTKQTKNTKSMIEKKMLIKHPFAFSFALFFLELSTPPPPKTTNFTEKKVSNPLPPRSFNVCTPTRPKHPKTSSSTNPYKKCPLTQAYDLP